MTETIQAHRVAEYHTGRHIGEWLMNRYGVSAALSCVEDIRDAVDCDNEEHDDCTSGGGCLIATGIRHGATGAPIPAELI